MVRQQIGSRATSCRIVFLAAAAVFLGSAQLLAQTPRPAMPDSVREYVSVAMSIFRANSVHRNEVDWPALEDSVVARAAGAQTTSGTWKALSWALRRVDRHSFLTPPANMIATMTGGLSPQAPQAPRPASRPPRRLDVGGIGVVIVPSHGGRNRPAFVDSLHAQLDSLDSAGVCGWVVDLRENGGGNMWPMLAGIGPLLGAEMVGSFTNSPPGTGWRYRDGRSWSGGSTAFGQPSGWGSATPRRLKHLDAPVALLFGSRTASSGEMVLLAFLGRPDVRTFGDSTAGFASANTSVPLRDGATLVVTTSYPRDRLGRTYPLRIAPDELVPAGDSAGADAALRRAVAWLRKQPTCAAR